MKRTLLIMALHAMITPGVAAELKFSGILGQSQPESAPPLRQTSVRSSVNAPDGTVLFSNDDGVYALNTKSRIAKKVNELNGILLTDGRKVFLRRNTIIYQLESQPNGMYKAKRFTDLRRGYNRVGIVDVTNTQRFGKLLKFFAYDAKNKQVFGWDNAGKELGVILNLADFNSKGRVLDVAVLPEHGYMVVSTEYPDLHVYRFDQNGKNVPGGIWPQRVPANYLALNKHRLWACYANARPLENTISGDKPLVLGDHNDTYVYSVSSSGDDGYFLACSQGLKYYNLTRPKQCDYRIGGINNQMALALANGLIIGIRGNGIICLNLDDLPDSPLLNTGNEPWRVGGNWSSIGIATAADGQTFLILDSKLNTAWRFNPAITKWNDKSRIVNLKLKLTNPTDIAMAGTTMVIADAGKLNVRCELIKPIIKVDAFNDNELIVAGSNFVALLKHGKVVWEQPLEAKDIATIGDYVVVACDELLLLNKHGQTVSRAPYNLSCLATSGRWLVGMDPAKSAILRFKLQL